MELSRVKLWLLFLNASGNRLAAKWNRKDAFYGSAEADSMYLLGCIGFTVYRLLRITIKSTDFNYIYPLVLVPILFHAFVAIVYGKKVDLVASDYHFYYPGKLGLIYNIVALCSTAFVVYYLVFVYFKLF